MHKVIAVLITGIAIVASSAIAYHAGDSSGETHGLHEGEHVAFTFAAARVRYLQRTDRVDALTDANQQFLAMAARQ